MHTVRIDCLVFGYRRFSVESEHVELALTLLLRAGLNVKMRSDGSFDARERDVSRILYVFSGCVKYSVSEPLGLPGAYKRLDCKVGTYLGIVASVFILGFFSSLVWDIRVDGNERLSDSSVIYALSEADFEIGDIWKMRDRSAIEAGLLDMCSDISWVNINKRGTVAYVTLIEKEEADKEETSLPYYANIVATEDCVIEEITVKRGTAEVKVGDTVRKGDLLISGILPETAGGALCYAEGSVKGRVSATISVKTDRSYEQKQLLERQVSSVAIKIFNFSINILKIYGNSGGECAIIKDIDGFSLFGVARLPVETVTEYSEVYRSVPMEYTDKELVDVTAARLTTSLSAYLAGADLLKIRTGGAFTDSGYCMTSELVSLREVAETVELCDN